jgi:hypothetical protein
VSGVDVPKVAAGPSFGCFAWLDVTQPAPTNITDDVRKYIAAVAELVAASRVLRMLAATTEEFPDWPEGWDWDRIDNALAAFGESHE